MEKQPKDIFDSKPGADFVSGYCITIFVDATARCMLDVNRMVWDKELNTYAYIPTDYVSSSEIPCGLCYMIYATEFEMRLAKTKTAVRYRNKKGYNLKYEIPSVQPVWFHKCWLRPQYDPTAYDTDAKKYRITALNSALRSQFPEEEVLRWKKAFHDTGEILYCRKKKSDI